MRSALLRGRTFAVAAPALALLATAAPPAVAAASPAGSAYGASASVSLLAGVLGDTGVLGDKGISVDTGKLAPSSTDGPTSASIVDVPLKGLVTAKAVTSSAKQDSDRTIRSKAAIVDAALPVLAPLAGRTPKASVISSECKSTADGITASSDLANLDLGRIGELPAGTGANRKLGVPGVLQVIVNEQIKHSDGSLTVNALHVKLLGGETLGALGSGDIVLASSTCGKVAPAVVTPPTTPVKPPAPGPGQVTIVPAGAPETGDGTLAAVTEQ
ncbi:choice-of-anchor P family protein [Amycolatopsis sp. PS_44_ISF1]|uniref:choice-of-anchor P family protein n=1 Tax=Amycolatopsis sp. PS_44_ISF1 TaxID=2974917 RepID=UPI0028E00D3A|nr:choice-of-anchor P family protein [Amycolatopsis sp. PS_44_ISF1]MDT8915437.1 choice-of-anchor P family protein [Amycolatopsis sp. PS_44_ISF1]